MVIRHEHSTVPNNTPFYPMLEARAESSAGAASEEENEKGGGTYDKERRGKQ
jgi:hypothetical protein